MLRCPLSKPRVGKTEGVKQKRNVWAAQGHGSRVRWRAPWADVRDIEVLTVPLPLAGHVPLDETHSHSASWFRSRPLPYWIVRIKCDNVFESDRAVGHYWKRGGSEVISLDRLFLVYNKSFGAFSAWLEPRRGPLLAALLRANCLTSPLKRRRQFLF